MPLENSDSGSPTQGTSRGDFLEVVLELSGSLDKEGIRLVPISLVLTHKEILRLTIH